jgi:hypothetical protein
MVPYLQPEFGRERGGMDGNRGAFWIFLEFFFFVPTLPPSNQAVLRISSFALDNESSTNYLRHITDIQWLNKGAVNAQPSTDSLRTILPHLSQPEFSQVELQEYT